MAALQLLAHATGSLPMSTLGIATYLTLLAVGLLSGSVAVLSLTYGHVEEAYRAGLTTAGRHNRVVPMPPPERPRWRSLTAVAVLPVLGVVLLPTLGVFAHEEVVHPPPAGPTSDPRGGNAGGPTPTPDPSPPGINEVVANECYRLIEDDVLRVTCEPLKTDHRQAPNAQRAKCWVWLPAGAGSEVETLARVGCDEVRDKAEEPGLP